MSHSYWQRGHAQRRDQYLAALFRKGSAAEIDAAAGSFANLIRKKSEPQQASGNNGLCTFAIFKFVTLEGGVEKGERFVVDVGQLSDKIDVVGVAVGGRSTVRVRVASGENKIARHPYPDGETVRVSSMEFTIPSEGGVDGLPAGLEVMRNYFRVCSNLF